MDWDKEEEQSEEAQAFLTFDVGDAVFAVGVDQVNEILDPQPLKPIPGAPARVKGMIDVRGRSIVTMDGADVFDVAGEDKDDQNDRLIVFEVKVAGVEFDDPLLAVRVDRVRAVESFLQSEIDPAPRLAGNHVTASSKRDGDTILFVDIDPSLAGLTDASAKPRPSALELASEH